MQTRSQHANHLQHILRVAEEVCLHDNAVESEYSLSAPIPTDSAVFHLTVENLPPESLLQLSPNRERTNSLVKKAGIARRLLLPLTPWLI